MPIIKVWCLPSDLDEDRLRRLHLEIVAAAVRVPELGFKNENDMTVLFPPNMMSYGLGTDIIVEVTGLLEKRERTIEVRSELARKIGIAVSHDFPDAKVEVLIYSFKPEVSGFWTSATSHREGTRDSRLTDLRLAADPTPR